ncbi:MAG: bifunctional precorrin-2 dehydrogenase/sirohydrochlorin ferrochelatase [Massilistercora timonensis]
MDRSYFPLFVDISGKKTLVVGGGRIARRRIKTLLSFTPDIWVVAPEVTEELEALAEEGRIHWIRGTYAPGIHEELPQIQMALAATDDPACNEAVARECRARGILVNVAHKKELCDFFFPAVVKRGELVAGICASGVSHKKARKAREAVEQALDSLDKE